MTNEAKMDFAFKFTDCKARLGYIVDLRACAVDPDRVEAPEGSQDVLFKGHVHDMDKFFNLLIAYAVFIANTTPIYWQDDYGSGYFRVWNGFVESCSVAPNWKWKLV